MPSMLGTRFERKMREAKHSCSAARRAGEEFSETESLEDAVSSGCRGTLAQLPPRFTWALLQ